ncbi:MAG: flagellar filament capping protein FliD [Phycisphaerales bacterium]|nr:flagellar filament capping protein FliD [Phycisphaerales bacterium]
MNPYRLSLTASKAGSAGAFTFDDGGLDFGMSVLSQGRDAVVFYGASDPAQAVAITSTTNTLSNVISGVTIDLKGTSNSAVALSVTQDNAAITTSIKAMVDAFNSVVTSLDKYDTYDSETKVRGLLLGDSTVGRIRSSLYSMVNRRSSELSGQFTALTQIGIRIGSGAKLQFNEATFSSALQTDREAVLQLFTFKETQSVDGTTTTTAAGLGVRFKELLDALTNSTNGTVQSRTDSINREIELNNDRIEAMDELLEAKRSRYQQQFNAMEQTLARLQSQSSALAGLSSLSSGTSG